MDVEKLIERLEAWNEQHLSVVCGSGHFACDYLCESEDCIVVQAATALSALQAENKRLNKIVCSIPTTPDSGRTVSQYDKEMSMCAYLDDLEAENEKLRTELEQVKRERAAAQSLLAERIGVRGAEPITTAFGLPIDRLHELAEADREGKIPKYTIGDTIYDRFGDAWEVTAVELHSMRTKNEWLYRCGHKGTDDYRALWHFEAFPSKEAALRREQE